MSRASSESSSVGPSKIFGTSRKRLPEKAKNHAERKINVSRAGRDPAAGRDGAVSVSDDWLNGIAVWFATGAFRTGAGQRDNKSAKNNVVAVAMIESERKLWVIVKNRRNQNQEEMLAENLPARLKLSADELHGSCRAARRDNKILRNPPAEQKGKMYEPGELSFDVNLAHTERTDRRWKKDWKVEYLKAYNDRGTIHAEMRALEWFISEKLSWKEGNAVDADVIRRHANQWKSLRLGISKEVCPECQLLLDAFRVRYQRDNIRANISKNWTPGPVLLAYCKARPDVKVTNDTAFEIMNRSSSEDDGNEALSGAGSDDESNSHNEDESGVFRHTRNNKRSQAKKRPQKPKAEKKLKTRI